MNNSHLYYHTIASLVETILNFSHFDQLGYLHNTYNSDDIEKRVCDVNWSDWDNDGLITVIQWTW